jgi:hypothetical protein
MKVRTRIAGTGLSAMLTIIGCGAMTILVSASVSACTGRAGPVSTGSSSFSPGESTSPTSPGSSSGSASPKSGSGSPAAASGGAGASSSASPAQAAAPTTNPPPTVAPAAGGGGTSGLQDPLLFVLGGAAVLAGAGSIAYRRKITRNR